MERFVEHPGNTQKTLVAYSVAIFRSFLRGLRVYFLNHFLNWIPFYFIRNFFYRNFFKLNFDNFTSIHLGVKFFGKCSNIHLGKWTVVNSGCIIDGRGTCRVGENVSLSREVVLLTMSHDMNDRDFSLKPGSIIIEDDVWIGFRALILPEVIVGKGAVVGAGSVVTKDVEPFTVVAGNPARVISKRKEQDYNKVYYKPFFGGQS